MLLHLCPCGHSASFCHAKGYLQKLYASVNINNIDFVHFLFISFNIHEGFVTVTASVIVKRREGEITEMNEKTNRKSKTRKSQTDRLSERRRHVTRELPFVSFFTAEHLSISGPSHLPSCPSSASPLF